MKTSLLKNETGQSAAETAIVLPVLLAVLCAVLDFGWIFANEYSVHQASYAGARSASLNVHSLTSSQLNALVETRVQENLWKDPQLAQVSVSVGVDQVSVTVTQPVRTLTFVAGTVFGETYQCVSTSVAVF